MISKRDFELLTFIRLLLLILTLTVSVVNSRSAVIYASYNDHTGFTRPDTIERFDVATGSDLGPFAAHTGLSLPTGWRLTLLAISTSQTTGTTRLRNSHLME